MGFVLKTWPRSSRMSESGMRMDRDAWYLYQRDVVIARLLARGATVLVAADVESPIFVHGFLVAERVGDCMVVHWAFTKRDSRGYGVARDLLDAAVELVGEGATRLAYSHDVRMLVEGYDSDGKRRLLSDRRIERKLHAMGFERMGVDVGQRETGRAA